MTTSYADERAARLKRLKEATDRYVQQEQDRINTEVTVLQAILDGRRAGQGAANDAVEAASAVAAIDLGWFLRGA